ncbi:putative NADH dehydrogenase [ubiquinone] 1 alpha subcomplex subunit 12 [Nymphon striatum]|nr:putative NADH dehydrogenase [ubiquinone] 1 alpha subcomplex subunit 12 [Nymphon striatum]
MAKYLGLDKIGKAWSMIKQNGGIISSAKVFFRMDELRVGTLIGTDKYGNKYYQDKAYFLGRSRWVEFNQDVFVNYDASQVPSEWHGWLHYNTDISPTVKPPKKEKWMADHIENLSGTKQAYMPYSTTKPKIHSWVPPNSKK